MSSGNEGVEQPTQQKRVRSSQESAEPQRGRGGYEDIEQPGELRVTGGLGTVIMVSDDWEKAEKREGTKWTGGLLPGSGLPSGYDQ